ncbi:MAG TPA: anthranilate synthase component I, partial [Chthoniobacterales bacterium]|nr:anthranilate synthase component I [Chthoniobacterales bacterium]
MTTAPLNPSKEAFLKIAEPGKLVPIYTEFVADYETPVGVLEKIDDGRRSFLLESAEVSDHVGRYSFLGSSPRVYFESRGSKIRIEENGSVQEFETDSDPLAELRKLMNRYSFVEYPGLPPFVGGAVGYIGYDVV